MITAKSDLYLLIGNPIYHSLSPIFQNAAFNYYGINGVYIALNIEKNNLDLVIKALKTLDIKGINITIPYSAKFDSQNATIKSYRCSYPYPGNYTAKVIVETGNLKPVEARANISVLQALSQTTQNNVSNTITSDTIIVNQKDSTQLNINNQTTTSIESSRGYLLLPTSRPKQERQNCYSRV